MARSRDRSYGKIDSEMRSFAYRVRLPAIGAALSVLLSIAPGLAPVAAASDRVEGAAAQPAARNAPPPRLNATPDPVRLGRPLSISGHGWPVIEFCERRVRLSLRSPEKRVAIGSARVGPRGGFRRTFTPHPTVFSPGRWRLVARMRCESGRDGSAVPVVRALMLRIV